MNNKRPITAEKAMERLEILCARSEHCEGELRRKLLLWGLSGADAEHIIESLRERRYVDDERFARAYVREKLRFSRWGRVKIRMGLMAKRVSSATIATAVAEEITEDEYEEILVSMLKMKMRSIEDVDSYEGRTRLFRFGVSRGFEPGLVSDVIRRKLL